MLQWLTVTTTRVLSSHVALWIYSATPRVLTAPELTFGLWCRKQTPEVCGRQTLEDTDTDTITEARDTGLNDRYTLKLTILS